MACPACGADRLLPLHFPLHRREEKAEAIVRPIAKCAGCGGRTYAPTASPARKELSN
jgi:hypothetical protein